MAQDSRMEFWVTIVGLLRRKRVLVPVLLVALSLGVLAFLGTPNTYTSHTTMVLTTTEYGGTQSQDPTKPTELTNPMLNFNDSLKTTSAILIEAMNTKGVAEQLGATGETTLIINDGRTNPDLLGLNGPFIYIVGESTSPAAAKNVVVQAQKLMQKKLTEWQNALNAPQKTYLGLADVVPPTTPEVRHSTKLGLIAFLFGFLVSLGIAYYGHQVRARRRARAAARRAAAGARPLGVAPPRSRRPRRGGPSIVSPVAHDPAPAPVPDPAPDVVADPVDEPVDEAVHEAVVDTDREQDPDQGPEQPGEDEATAVVAPTPLTRPGPIRLGPTPLKKAAPPVVAVPVKLKVRSRNR
jgi:capsular polysaccharide biosynthesis protein